MKKLLVIVCMLLSVCSFVGFAEAQAVVGANCTISWNANTEPDLGGYRVYGLQNSVTKTIDIVKPTVITTCAALGTQAGGPLVVQVDAVDLVGNRSPKSVNVNVIQDITSPTQPSGVTVTPNP